MFDLDGVLVDSRAVMEAAFRHAYAAVVGPGAAPFAAYCRYLGWLFSDIMRAMDLPLAMEEPFVAESERLIGQIRIFDEVVPVLDELRGRGVRLSVATGRSRPRAERVLQVTGLARYVDAFVGSDEVAAGKPAPDVFLEAAARIEVSPAEALTVGDAVADIVGSRAAGIAAAAATWGETPRSRLLDARPDHVLDAPTDLLLLDGLR